MRRKLARISVRMASLFLAMMFMVTPAFAIVREVNVYGVKSINDMGESDQRVTMNDLKDAYSDYVQTDTLREYFHKDKSAPAKVDLSVALSWLIDNNIISRDQTVTVTRTGSNQIPVVDITKFPVSDLASMNVTRTDMLMYTYKAAFGPINARIIGVETDNVRVDDGEEITLKDLMEKNGYTTNPNYVLPGSGSVTSGGTSGTNGTGNGGGGSASSGSNQQTNYINDMSNWRYQPQGDLWESIFGDTNIFISQNNFQQGITGGNAGNAGGGGAGIGSGGTGGGGNGGPSSNQTQVNTGNVGSIQGSDNNQTTTNSNNISGTGNPIAGDGSASGSTGSGTAGDNSSGQGGSGGDGGDADTGDNTINYETDYKQIYFIPGADLLVYQTSDVPEVYIQAALSKGLIGFDARFRSDEFTKEFITWPAANKNTLQSWDNGSPAYVVNRTRNVLKTHSNTEQVPTQEVLGKHWNVSWQSNTLTISRPQPFSEGGKYFTSEEVSKMDAYEYIYNFIKGSEKELSELEAEIVNYKYGMELDGITDEEGTTIIKYLIAKGIINYEITTEFLFLDSPISWTEFITLLYRVANKDARLDFTKIQLTDSETQWKARGYAPQTTYLVPGEHAAKVQTLSFEEFSNRNFGTEVNEAMGTTGTGISDPLNVSQTQGPDGINYLNFGDGETEFQTIDSSVNQLLFYELTSILRGAASNSQSNNNMNYESLSEACEFFGENPSTNVGKYTLCLAYSLAVGKKDNYKDPEAFLTQGYNGDNPKMLLYSDVVCNIWALCDMQTGGTRSEVTSMLNRIKELTRVSDDNKKRILDQDNYKATIANIYGKLNTNLSKVSFQKFVFTDDQGNNKPVLSTWVSETGGQVLSLMTRITAVEMTIQIDNNPQRCVLSMPKYVGTSRGYSAELGNPWDVDVKATLSADIWVDPNLTDEEQLRQRQLNFSNNVCTFANLSAIQNTPLDTYVEPNTKDCYIGWSSVAKYLGSSSLGDNSLQIEKVSDFVLHNKATDTYAYFKNEEGGESIALVGTDVVTCSNDYGVAYREGSEMYYLIDALRLLMDSKQEMEVLGGIRSMPFASTAVQNNLTKVTLDFNTGVTSQSLTGIRVMLSDDDTETKKHVPDQNSVYYADTSTSNNIRWGNFLSISQSNRAINATSRQFSYVGKDGAKLTAYAVVIFEPLAPSALGYSYVDETSSLQDLLDSPMKKPETEADIAKWEENKTRSNLLANWIYNTTGKEYVSTGYLVPHAYVFSSDPDIAGCMTDAEWGCLTTQPIPGTNLGSQRELVSFVRLYDVINGAVLKFGATCYKTASEIRADPAHQASYQLSADYRLCILGNRVYLNLGCFTNVSKIAATKLRTANTVLGSAAFTVGSSFKSIAATTATSIGGDPVPKIMVTKTENNGLVTCQVGPIYGVPLQSDTSTQAVLIHDYSGKSTDDKTIGDYDWTTADNNQMQWMFEFLFQPTGRSESYANIKLLGMCESPILSANSTRAYLMDSRNMYAMSGTGRLNKGEPIGVYITRMGKGNKLNGLLDGMNQSGAYQNVSTQITNRNVEAYFEIQFNAFEYTVVDGVLKYEPNQASNYISPSLFSSLNDLIINGLMNEDNGAIPIEQVPFGSNIEIGTGWYNAYGTSADDIAFVGYAPLDGFTEQMDHCTVQDAAKSFASHFLRAGNQQINICHFFNTMDIVADVNAYKEPLDLLNNSKMAEDNTRNKKFILGVAGENGTNRTGTIYTSPISTASTLYYAPVNITFQKGLVLAYKTSADGVEPASYRIVSNAVNSASGPLDNLPFFSDNALTGSMTERTSKATSGGFMMFYGADNLMDRIHADFQKAFAGDLFTLARMLVFIVLVWLVVASWMCYATYFGGLMPILDAIKHPTGDQAGKGIDLMKIVSLGSISMETDFKLGRFIQYNVVLAALICVVYLTGIYF